jgi:hypothetical protein
MHLLKETKNQNSLKNKNIILNDYSDTYLYQLLLLLEH